MLRPVARLQALLALNVLLGASGCYHTYSQPYGYSGYPSTYPAPMQYQAPMQTLTPGQPYTPGMTTPGTPPATGTPTYQPPSGGLQPIPDNSAPPYNNNGNGSSNTSPTAPDPYYNSTYVPPESSGLSSVQPTAMNEPAPLNPPAVGLREVRSAPPDFAQDPLAGTSAVPPASNSTPTPTTPSASGIPQTPVSSTESAMTPVPTAAEETFAIPKVSPPPSNPAPEDPFGSPAAPLQAAPDTAEPLWDVETKKVVTPTSGTDIPTFAHDPKYQWLRGVVTQEPQDHSWSIIYDDNPGEDDRWAGHLSLAPSPELESLKDGDVVEIQGRLDDVVQDRLGKPVYVISRLRKVFE